MNGGVTLNRIRVRVWIVALAAVLLLPTSAHAATDGAPSSTRMLSGIDSFLSDLFSFLKQGGSDKDGQHGSHDDWGRGGGKDGDRRDDWPDRDNDDDRWDDWKDRDKHHDWWDDCWDNDHGHTDSQKLWKKYYKW